MIAKHYRIFGSINKIMRMVDSNVISIGCTQISRDIYVDVQKLTSVLLRNTARRARLLRLQHSCTPTGFVRIKCDERDWQGQNIRHLTI